jgi:hypothetical protein
VQPLHDDPFADHGVCKAELPVELERASLHDHRARMFPRSVRSVNQPERNALSGETVRQHEPRRPGSSN